MHLLRGFVRQRLMWPPGVVASDVGSDACFRLLETGVFLEVDLLVLDGAPETFGEDIIVVAAAARPC